MKEYKPSIYCPEDCPFLSIYNNKVDKIPYHCDLFDSYLAFDGEIMRCSGCLGIIQHEDKNDGFNFINAIKGAENKSITKWTFNRLSKESQNIFIDHLKKFGEEIHFPIDAHKIELEQIKNIEKTILNIAKTTKSEQNRKEMSKEETELKNLLDLKSEQFPGLMGHEDKTLISNLYKVLDETEKQIMKSILNNENTLDAFVKSLQEKPKNDSLLKNVRSEMDDIMLKEAERQKEQQKYLSLQQQIKRQQIGR